jgi:hypothetical protein
LGYVDHENRYPQKPRIPLSRFSPISKRIHPYTLPSLIDDRYELIQLCSGNRHMSTVVLDKSNNVSYNTLGSEPNGIGVHEDWLADIVGSESVYLRDRVFRDLDSDIYSIGDISHVMLDRVSTEDLYSGSYPLVGRYILNYRYNDMSYSVSIGRHTESLGTSYAFQWAKSKVHGGDLVTTRDVSSYIWDVYLHKHVDGYMAKLGLL